MRLQKKMSKYVLGSIEASEQLIKDLYINLRNTVNIWSKITNQTPQARMGYIGQHLVSVVTGYPGGKSGARGHDLVMSDGEYGEIKTCYRVDQLGKCGVCGNSVSSLETECSRCTSNTIIRKDDSKWLINIRNSQELSKISEPKRYYFVLFEFENIDSCDNNIIASIWEVDPKNKGFKYCMIDYYLNIRSKSESKAPFNMWPYHIKFELTNPMLIYRSIIYKDGTIDTKIFPTLNNGYIDELKQLQTYSSSSTLTTEVITSVIKRISPESSISGTKKKLLEQLEELRTEKGILNKDLCELLADAIYYPNIEINREYIPENLLAS